MNMQRLIAFIRIEENAPSSYTKNRWHNRCRNCRREDSNLHSLNGNQVLNLARLPFRHFGAVIRHSEYAGFMRLVHYSHVGAAVKAEKLLETRIGFCENTFESPRNLPQKAC